MLQPIIASGFGSRPFARFPPSHLRNAARIVSSQARLKSNCSAIAEIRFMNSPMRMGEDLISLALDQRGRVPLTNPPKSEQCRKHRVVSQPVDVDVPRKSADDREHGRADDVADIGAFRFVVGFSCATQSIPYFEGCYFRSPIA